MTVLARHRLRIGSREILLLGGPKGWGECSPLEGYPVPVAAALRSAREAACEGWPPARRTEVAVNALVTGHPVKPATLRSFGCVKVKVGRPELESDVALVSAVREAVGERVALRIDANGRWGLDEAERAIERLAGFDLELVEQPVSSLDDLARLRRRVAVPLAADESVRSLEDARRLRALGAADAVVLKVQALGGVRRALAIAEAAGVPAIVSSMYETSVGIAAGLALAAALPELPYACGLATLDRIEGDVASAPLAPERGRLRMRSVVPDPGLISSYEARARRARLQETARRKTRA